MSHQKPVYYFHNVIKCHWRQWTKINDSSLNKVFYLDRNVLLIDSTKLTHLNTMVTNHIVITQTSTSIKAIQMVEPKPVIP